MAVGKRSAESFEDQFDFPLERGMKIAVSKTKRNQQGFKSRYVKIVYEDKWIIVVEKAVGILSMAAGHSSLNVKAVLDDYFKKSRQKCTAHVVHRLDRDTSGLMVYAKDMETEQILEHNWHDIVYDRRYVAVCSGEMENDEGTVANWLKDNKAYVTYSSPVDNGGKYAVTHYHVMARTTEHTLVEFKLETGRKNQIRVHSADMGHPVCGDPKYGNGDDPLHRLCLHAWLLCFHHPVTGEPMEGYYIFALVALMVAFLVVKKVASCMIKSVVLLVLIVALAVIYYLHFM